MSQGIRHAPLTTFANVTRTNLAEKPQGTVQALLILSAVDSFNLIYSLACVNMSKISSVPEALVKSDK